MAEKINLADFEFNVDGVVKSTAELRASIEALKKEQKELREDVGETNTKYVENEAKLKSLNSEYRENIKVLQQNIESTTQAAQREELLSGALNTEATTISELRAQNKELNKLRNDTNLETEEGRKELELLNAKLDENNVKIKENSDKYTQQKINIGNYSSALDRVIPGLSGMIAGIQGATKASLAFIATPIGALLAALGVVLGLVATAFTSVQSEMDKVTAIARPLTAVMEVLFGIIQKAGSALIAAFSNPAETMGKIRDFVKDNIIPVFQGLGEIVSGIFTLDFDRAGRGYELVASKATEGFEAAKGAAQGLADEIQRGIDLGKEYDLLQKELERTQIRNAELLPQLNAELKEQNKIAEDLTKSTQEREAAALRALEISDQIRAVKQEERNLELEIAENLAARNDTSREDELEIARIKGQIFEADAAAAEQQTTLQNKLNTIRKEGLALQQKSLDEAITKQQKLLSLFEAEQGERARTLAEEVELAEEVANKKRDILKKQLDANKIDEIEYRTEILNLDEDLALKRAELASDNVRREIENNRRVIEAKREDELFLSQELANIRKGENDRLLEQEKELAKLKLEQGLLNQQEFDEQIRELSEANRIANREIDKEREQLEKEEALELRAIEFEEEIERLIEEGATRFEIEQAQAQEQSRLALDALNESLDKQLISQRLYEARKKQLEDKAAKEEIKRQKILARQKVDAVVGTIDAVSSVINEDSAAGKAIALSQALINTYQGISAGVRLGLPQAIPAVAYATATGFKAVEQISSTDVPSASGGGSVPESNASSLAINQSNLSDLAASGNVAVQNQIQQGSDSLSLTEAMTEAVAEGSRQGTREGTTEGMTNLSDNRQIQNESTF